MQHLKYLYKFLFKHKQKLLVGVFFVLVSNIFALYPAEFVRKAFDTILESTKNINHSNLDTNFNSSTNKIILKFTSLILLFSVLKGIFMYFMRQTIIVVSRNIEFDLKNEIYQKYQQLNLEFYKKNKTGDLMNRISEDVSKVRMAVGPGLMYTINITTLFFLVINRMLDINTKLTLFTLIPFPLLAISIYYVSNKINTKSEKAQKQLSKITATTQESYSGIEIIKSFNQQKNILKNFVNQCQNYTRKQIDLIKIEAFFFPLIIVLIGSSTLITIYVGGLESFKNNISTGNIAEFIIYINMLAWPIASIGWITSLIQRASASQERINKFLKIKPKIYQNNNKNTFINGSIKFEDVSLIYNETNIKALKNIDLEVYEGKTLGIFGKTGSGKTTLLDLITRLYDTTSGKIYINNKNIKEINLSALRSHIGYVPQDGYLFSGTIKDNIIFSNDNYNYDKMVAAAKYAEILDEIYSFKDGFNTIVGERGVQLSGGQKQRLSIARVFYKDPSMYIFDDCLSAIDKQKSKNILINLNKKMKSKTSIIVSHKISSLEKLDNIIVLKEGEIIQRGSHKTLIGKSGYYKEVFNKQSSNLENI
tara:strand:- start:545 stop:2320 length:1776 start_codon:yes stop_codon:yes gene_type:complete